MEPSGDLLGNFFREPPRDFTIEQSAELASSPSETLLKVKSACELQYSNTSNLVQPQRILNQDALLPYGDKMAASEPTDLSNKRTENVTCVPEIEYLKEDTDTIPEEFSNSTTPSEASPTPETVPQPPTETDLGLWQALLRKGYKHFSLLSQFGEEKSELWSSLDAANAERSSARRKQSFPSKANVQAEAMPTPMEHQDNEEDDSRERTSPDFTGNSPWCNLVKGKSGTGMGGKRVGMRCTNSGTQNTAIWRRNLRGEMVCNACGLYFKLQGIGNHTFPCLGEIETYAFLVRLQSGPGMGGKRVDLRCTNCGTQTTTIWRRNLRGEMVPPMPKFPPSEVSIGCAAAREAEESDEDSIADLPLNLVSTQMAEGELL
ncbi:unnamed protein product [Phaedon cochleariae]|uniref:GATA-type domain-containing protein n=1 Tax=Phaedon cochleariae TaxID=80249 RepID=A0A9P0DHX8_PHACE|nr:unnamed protein product [Phaedon cochleariae]